jgi:hypothetical protein
MGKPLILVTNDDGIESPGLRAAVEVAVSLGDVLVAAPMEQQTSSGRGYARGQPAVFAVSICFPDIMFWGLLLLMDACHRGFTRYP